MTKGGKLGRFIPRDFSGVPGEFSVVGRKVTAALLDGVQFSLSILDSVEVAKGVLEDLYQGSKVGKVNGVVFHVGGDLIKVLILEAVDGEV